MMRRLMSLGLTALLLCACQRETDGKLAELSGRIFVFNYRVATANYLITLQKTAPFPKDVVAEAEFEDPQGGSPLVVRQPVFPAFDKIVLESPFLLCVRKDKPYAVKIRLLGAGDKLLQAIDTSVTSDVDQTIMPFKPLVIGSGYTPNPDVFKPDGTLDYAQPDCPK